MSVGLAEALAVLFIAFGVLALVNELVGALDDWVDARDARRSDPWLVDPDSITEREAQLRNELARHVLED